MNDGDRLALRDGHIESGEDEFLETIAAPPPEDAAAYPKRGSGTPRAVRAPSVRPGPVRE